MKNYIVSYFVDLPGAPNTKQAFVTVNKDCARTFHEMLESGVLKPSQDINAVGGIIDLELTECND